MLAGHKGKAEKAMMPLLRLLKRAGVPANAVTLFSLFLLIPFAYFISQGEMLWAFGVFAFMALADAVDGGLARLSKPTKFGDFFDAFIDRIVEGGIYISIAVFMPELAIVSMLCMALSYMVSYSAARAEVWTIGEKIRYVSIGSRAERLILLGGGLLFNALQYALPATAALSLIGLGQRFIAIRKSLK